jgi:signal transduction histidine kinase
MRSGCDWATRLVLQSADVMWPMVFAVSADDRGLRFYLTLLFSSAAAAYRWSVEKRVATTAGLCLLMGASATSAAFGGATEPGGAMAATAGAFLTGVALGYLAGQERRRRAESDLVIRVIRNMRIEEGLLGTLAPLAGELLNALEASRVLMASLETASGQAFLWTAHRADQHTRTTLRCSALALTERECYFFAAPATWHAVLARPPAKRDALDIVALGLEGRRLRHVPSGFVPDRFMESQGCHSLLVVSLDFGTEWLCRLFVLDPGLDGRRAETLRLMRDLIGDLGPSVHNAYLFQRSQDRAATMERRSLARALHDDLIQSLIGAEARVHALRRQATDAPANVAAELSRIEDIIHQEVLGVRNFMQRLKPVRLGSEDLLDFLADHVGKFGLDTGITARFLPNVRQVSLPAWMCIEIARIVQEALSNVRKHSGARHVWVRLSHATDRWSLIIEDDGRGLGLEGAAESPGQDGTLLTWPPPMVIKECVRSLGGELKLHSGAGGLRLEITFQGRPQPGDLKTARFREPATDSELRVCAAAAP